MSQDRLALNAYIGPGVICPEGCKSYRPSSRAVLMKTTDPSVVARRPRSVVQREHVAAVLDGKPFAHLTIVPADARNRHDPKRTSQRQLRVIRLGRFALGGHHSALGSCWMRSSGPAVTSGPATGIQRRRKGQP
jgi:hypothetical protein